MQKYELMLAIRGSLLESEQSKTYQELVAYMQKNGATIVFEESWGSIKLAYKMAHETSAYYHVVHFTYEGSKMSALETFMQIESNIVRSLITKVEGTEAPFTKADYQAGMDAYYQTRGERQRKAAPKTRATTAKQLEEEMSRMPGKPKVESKVQNILDNDLSL